MEMQARFMVFSWQIKMSNLLHAGLILIISRVCRNREYRGNFQNKAVISKQLFCQMSAQVKWEGRGNVNYYKSIYHPIPTLPVGTGSTLSNFQNKSVYQLSFQLSFQKYSLLVQTERDLFWKGGRRGTTLQYHLVDISKRWNLK